MPISRKYISLMIMIAFSLQACASQEVRRTREGDPYKTKTISTRDEISYRIFASSPTKIRITSMTDTYETHRRYYEGMEDVTTKNVSWTVGHTVFVAFGIVVTAGIALLPPFLPAATKRNSQAALSRCSRDGQIIEGYKCSISTESKKTGSYIERDEKILLKSEEATVNSGSVMVSINGRPVEDISIRADGTAELDLFKFPELARTKKDVNIEYRYRNAMLSTTLESAVSYVAKRILSEIRSKGWSRVAVVELNTKGMPESFQESLLKEIESQHTQDNKDNSVVKPALISKTLKALQTDVADILKQSSTGITKEFGNLIEADGIIGGKIIKTIQTAGMKKWPDIFDTEGIQIDLRFVDIENGK